MYPGLSDADCQVAALRHHQLINEGQRQQLSAGSRSASGVTRFEAGSLRLRVGTLLVSAGQRLQGQFQVQVQGVQAVTTERLDSVAIGEPAAIG